MSERARDADVCDSRVAARRSQRLCIHLSDAEFETVFKMPREKFAKQPVWRQQNMKRAAGLF